MIFFAAIDGHSENSTWDLWIFTRFVYKQSLAVKTTDHFVSESVIAMQDDLRSIWVNK